MYYCIVDLNILKIKFIKKKCKVPKVRCLFFAKRKSISLKRNIENNLNNSSPLLFEISSQFFRYFKLSDGKRSTDLIFVSLIKLIVQPGSQFNVSTERHIACIVKNRLNNNEAQHSIE